MRLWHESLIPRLPREQLLGQHRECCALRGLGWEKPHATVNYVFEHPFGWLVAYHFKVMREMLRRGYTPAREWFSTEYRGKIYGFEDVPQIKFEIDLHKVEREMKLSNGLISTIYPEHDDAYLQECLDNLARKGIKIEMEEKK